MQGVASTLGPEEQKENVIQTPWSQDFPRGPGVKNLLPTQGTQVQPMVREDPTSSGAIKPVCKTTEPACCTREACTSRARATQEKATAMRSPCTATTEQPTLAATFFSAQEKAHKDPAQPKIKIN